MYLQPSLRGPSNWRKPNAGSGMGSWPNPLWSLRKTKLYLGLLRGGRRAGCPKGPKVLDLAVLHIETKVSTGVVSASAWANDEQLKPPKVSRSVISV